MAETPVNAADLVQVFIKLQHEKRGKWTSAKPVLSYDKASGIVTVPGQNSKTIKAAVEDVRFAISDDELAVKYQEAIDALDIALDDSVDVIADDTNAQRSLTEPENYDDDEIGPTHAGQVGGIYWSGDYEYYPGTVDSYDPDSGNHKINYNDGDRETIDTENHQSHVISISQAIISDLSEFHAQVLESYFKTFGHKEFMLHHAEGLPPHTVWKAYQEEESKFMKTVREVSIDKVPKG